MVVCHSDANLAEGVESSSDNGEGDSDTICSENIPGLPARTCSYNNLTSDIDSDTVGKFENISVCNSSDIHFGNKTFYNGPVTIKQFVYSPEEKSKIVEPSKEGNVNISHFFKKLNDNEVEDSAHVNPLFVPTNDVRRTPVGLVQNCNSLGAQENLKYYKEFHTSYLTCHGPPLHYIVTAATVLLVTVLLVALTVLVLKYENRAVSSISISPETVSGQPADVNFTLSGKLRIMQRKEWLAQPIAAPITELTTPVPYVIISHTATEECKTIAQCILLVRTVQTFHIESKGWWDIGYNFLVGGDGFAYVGRSWDLVGAHAYGYNNVSIGISFMGTFNNVLPPSRQLTAAKQLIELGVNLGKISKNYKLLAHRQVSATESPGAELYQELQKWSHWAPHP